MSGRRNDRSTYCNGIYVFSKVMAQSCASLSHVRKPNHARFSGNICVCMCAYMQFKHHTETPEPEKYFEGSINLFGINSFVFLEDHHLNMILITKAIRTKLCQV
jgi:hypothetical protein